MNFENIILNIEDHLVTLTINKPETLNALDTSLYTQVGEACDYISELLDKGQDLRCVILTGAGEKSFVAGADIGEMSDLDLRSAKAFAKVSHIAFNKLAELAIPTIAAVNGYALGGGFELALACDIRIASENARFSFPETGLGITPGSGGTQRLGRLVGPSVAKELIFTGRSLKAAQAAELGIVNKVVAHEDLEKESKEFSKVICSKAPFAIRAAKTAIDKGLQSDIDTGLNLEIEVFSQCFTTEDQKTAMKAFLDKSSDFEFINK
ncbi:MAG: enoyl-CoA hydratase [Clostridiaceae bacterium]|nr:enoyl-CoA hydratase [Clostridiaceae bacterium]